MKINSAQELKMTPSDNRHRKNHGPSGPLYDLLIAKLPEYTQIYGGHRRLHIYRLADAIGGSYQHIYQVLPSGDKSASKNLPVKLARKLIACSEAQTDVPEGFEPLTIVDLEPYLPS